MKVKGCRELVEEVIGAGLCAYCGACTGRCPYLVSYKGRIVPLDNCTVSEGQCFRYCPRTPIDLNAISREVFGTGYSGDELGNLRHVLIARSTDSHIRQRAQYGGTVTALVSLALEGGLIDCAILGKMSGERIPGGFPARNMEQILQCSGTSYMVCPILEALNRVPRDSTERFGIVATPCQVLALSKMKKDPPQNRVNIVNVRLVIGLFCTWALNLDEFHGFLRENLDLSGVVKFDIPPPPANRFDVYSRSGKTSFPLERIRKFIMPACSYCMDMTAEFGDISVGSAEGIEGWNTVIVRTEAGSDLMDLAKKKGVLETGALPDQNLAHLKTAAMEKKRRALRNIVEKTGGKGNFLYVGGLSEGVIDKVLGYS